MVFCCMVCIGLAVKVRNGGSCGSWSGAQRCVGHRHDMVWQSGLDQERSGPVVTVRYGSRGVIRIGKVLQGRVRQSR